MYTKTYAVTALAAAALLVLSAREALSQSSGSASSNGTSNFYNGRQPDRYLEPPLHFDWRKTLAPKDTLDPFSLNLSIRERDLIPDPFSINRDLEEFKDSAFLLPSPTADDPAGAAPILRGASNGDLPSKTITKWKGKKGRRRAVRIKYTYLRRAVAFVDDYYNMPSKFEPPKECEDSSEDGADGSFGDTFSSEGYNSGYNTGSQTEQIVDGAGAIKEIIIVEPLDYLNVRPLRKTLHDIWQIQVAPNGLTRANRSSLGVLFMRASQQEDNRVMKHYYQFRSHLVVKDISKAFAEIDKIYALDPDNDEILKDVADEFFYENLEVEESIVRLYPKGIGNCPAIRIPMTKGLRALKRKDWSMAWQMFEQVNELNPRPGLVQEIAETYYAESRDVETCLWCSRWLAVAEDWKTFKRAWDVRAFIEQRCYDEYLKREPYITAHWPASKVPLKVYYVPDAMKDADFYLLMEQCLKDWMFVARGKLDYKHVFDESEADLIIARPLEVDTRYTNMSGGSTPPKEVPRPPASGMTFPQLEGAVMKKARVEVYDSMQAMKDEERRELYLHELGHAFGMIGHSKDVKDIMYPYGRCESDFLIRDNNLSFGDVQRMKAAYGAVPLNNAAVGKYTGMKAACQSLEDNPQIVLSSELPEHQANLMPVLESIGFGGPKRKLVGRFESQRSRLDLQGDSFEPADQEDLTGFWSPGKHSVPDNLGTERMLDAMPGEDPFSKFSATSGKPNPGVRAGKHRRKPDSQT